MKFQDSSFNGLKVTVGTKSVTHPRTHPPTHAPTHAPKAICPINFFKVGGIKKCGTDFDQRAKHSLLTYPKTMSVEPHKIMLRADKTLRMAY